MSDQRSPKEKVWMEHPMLGPDRKQLVSLKQLKNVWRLSGWFETEAPPPPPKKEKSGPVVMPKKVKAPAKKTPAKKPAAKKSTKKKNE